MDAPGSTVSRESVVGHTGAMCDDCGGDHGFYPVTQRGTEYILCESCYEYAAMVAEVESEPDAGEQEDDFSAEEDEDEDAEYGDAWWADATQDARDNGAYGLLTSAGGGW